MRLATTLLKDEAMCRERSFSRSDGGETMKEICVCLRPMQQWIFIEQVCVQLPTYADNVTLLAFAAAERRAAVRRVIDRYLLPAGPTAANPPQRYAVVDRWDRQTGGQTDTVSFYRSCAYCSSTVRYDCVCVRSPGLAPERSAPLIRVLISALYILVQRFV